MDKIYATFIAFAIKITQKLYRNEKFHQNKKKIKIIRSTLKHWLLNLLKNFSYQKKRRRRKEKITINSKFIECIKKNIKSPLIHS